MSWDTKRALANVAKAKADLAKNKENDKRQADEVKRALDEVETDLKFRAREMEDYKKAYDDYQKSLKLVERGKQDLLRRRTVASQEITPMFDRANEILKFRGKIKGVDLWGAVNLMNGWGRGLNEDDFPRVDK